MSSAHVVALLVFGTYLLAARGPRNLFPLSVFDMYQGRAPDTVARMLVLDGDGKTAEVDAFEGWSCEWEHGSVVETCGEAYRLLDYVERDQRDYLDRHRGGGGEALKLVARSYRLRGEARQPASSDCVVARCLARRR